MRLIYRGARGDEGRRRRGAAERDEGPAVREPARPGHDRSRHARPDPERLPAQGREGRTASCGTSSSRRRPRSRTRCTSRLAPSRAPGSAHGAGRAGPTLPSAHPRARPHADDPLRRHRLRDAAVPDRQRARGHARADELHQPRARRVRDGGRLSRGGAVEPDGRAVPRRRCRSRSCSRRRSARCSSRRCTGACTSGRISTRCCSRSASCSWRWRRVDYFFGATQQFVKLPDVPQGPLRDRRRGHRQLPAVHHRGVRRARARARAASWRARASAASCARRSTTRASPSGMGINVNAVFLGTFAFGSGLAGLGGALGAELLGLDPTFPLKYMIYFLVVVAVGGTTTITGPLLASLLLGVADVAGKYYVPKAGRVHHLLRDDRRAARAAAGPVRAGDVAMSRADRRRSAPGAAAAHARAAVRGRDLGGRGRRGRRSSRATRRCGTRSRSSRCSRCRST